VSAAGFGGLFKKKQGFSNEQVPPSVLLPQQSPLMPGAPQAPLPPASLGSQGGVLGDDVGMEIEQSQSMGMSQPENITRFILETADIIEELENKLKGNIWVRDRWVKKGKALLNNEGVSKIVLLFANFINRHMALSNFSEDDVRRIAMRARLALIDLIERRWQAYEIDSSDFDMIVVICDASIYAMLKRAYKGGEREGLSSRYKHVETPVVHSQPKRGLFR
jgi:hypothetical protein